MILQEHKTHKNDRIRLKGQGQDALYEAACAGSEGWVRHQRHDQLGYPEIFVEWDRTHWTYNGEKDGWTMESHFDIVEDAMTEPSGNDDDLLKRLAKERGFDLVPVAEKEDIDAEYRHIAEEAYEAIREGEAFLVICVNKLDDGTSRVAQVFNGFKTEPDQLLVEANLTRLGAKAHERIVAQNLKEILEDQ